MVLGWLAPVELDEDEEGALEIEVVGNCGGVGMMYVAGIPATV